MLPNCRINSKYRSQPKDQALDNTYLPFIHALVRELRFWLMKKVSSPAVPSTWSNPAFPLPATKVWPLPEVSTGFVVRPMSLRMAKSSTENGHMDLLH
jgi:hypothetical protein